MDQPNVSRTLEERIAARPTADDFKFYFPSHKVPPEWMDDILEFNEDDVGITNKVAPEIREKEIVVLVRSRTLIARMWLEVQIQKDRRFALISSSPPVPPAITCVFTTNDAYYEEHVKTKPLAEEVIARWDELTSKCLLTMEKTAPMGGNIAEDKGADVDAYKELPELDLHEAEGVCYIYKLNNRLFLDPAVRLGSLKDIPIPTVRQCYEAHIDAGREGAHEGVAVGISFYKYCIEEYNRFKKREAAHKGDS